jgi:pimeloyl-ACP methyl ester carboxylesterase
MNHSSKGNYAEVNGLSMYYEIHGTGEPLVLLNGGPTTIDTSFGAVLPVHAKSWKVIAVEQQGHGHTADIDRPMSFPQMADDTASLLKYLGIEQADFFGYSDGGNVGLGVAIRHLELVRKLVVAGTNLNNDGLTPGMVETYRSLGPDDLGNLEDAYVAVAPRPEDWPVLVRKVMQMAVDFSGWRPEEIREIKVPTLFIIGDADIVRPEHAVEMFRLLPHARLAVLPGTDHVTLIQERSGWLLSMITEFLGAPKPEAG